MLLTSTRTTSLLLEAQHLSSVICHLSSVVFSIVLCLSFSRYGWWRGTGGDRASVMVATGSSAPRAHWCDLSAGYCCDYVSQDTLAAADLWSRHNRDTRDRHRHQDLYQTTTRTITTKPPPKDHQTTTKRPHSSSVSRQCLL